MGSSVLAVVVAVGLFALAQAKQISFTDCGSQNGVIVAVDITPCSSEPCAFKRGQTVAVEVDFMSTLNNSSTAILTAFATIFGDKVPLNLAQPDACKLPGTTCPLLKSTLEKPVEQVVVPSNIPPIFIPIPLQVILTGDSNQNIFCGQVQVKIS
ncbi:hypothetical protein BV898_12904 [Hypsibius exemplaris]|uniref:MD-2-related lipid-recognition domain-containing protein n=1 Tax=Hypsibius exemplaris TaxID=2072580 RepID=A0A1W0WCD1_HYPEX|nr:hypothetical protein BV898_12904 [Hypsibius exemplaris]